MRTTSTIAIAILMLHAVPAGAQVFIEPLFVTSDEAEPEPEVTAEPEAAPSVHEAPIVLPPPVDTAPATPQLEQELELEEADSGSGFGEFGLGTQMVVLSGDEGSEAGVGVSFRTRFLWVLGFEMSVTRMDAPDHFLPPTIRTGLLLHAIRTEAFGLYLSPGLAARSFSDSFDPNGSSTWYRLGGGVEFRVADGLALGGEAHWTLPTEASMTRYMDENGEALVQEFLSAQGVGPDATPAELQALAGSANINDLLAISPLDRLEFTIGLRYYF